MPPSSLSVFPRRWQVLPVVLVAAFMALFDVFVVNVAAPSIQRDLGASNAAVQLVVGGYSFTYAAGLVTGGRLGDLFGHRRLFVGGMVAFALASAAAGLAQHPAELVAARLVQGLTGAAMVPQVLALIQALFTPEERPRALSWYGATIGLGSVAGQVLGGVLLQANVFGLGWRAIFWVNVRIGLVTAGLGAWLLPPTRGERRIGVDPWWGGRSHRRAGAGPRPPDPRPGGALALGAGPDAGRRRPRHGAGRPLRGAPLRARRPSAPQPGDPAGAVVRRRPGGGGRVLRLLRQLPARDGRAAPGRAAALGAGRRAHLRSPRDRLRRGVARRPPPGCPPRPPPHPPRERHQLGGCVLLLAVVEASGTATSAPRLVAPLLVIGVGNGLTMPSLIGVILRGVPVHKAGAGAGTLNTANQFAATAGVALLGVVFFNALGAHPGLAGELRGMERVLVLDAGLLALAMVATRLLPDGRPAPATPAAEPTTAAVTPVGRGGQPAPALAACTGERASS